MYSVPEQLTNANKAGVETLVTIANAAFGGIERLAALNLNTVRGMLEDSTANTRALLAVTDMQEFTSLPIALAQPGFEKASTYSRSIYQIAAETQEALSEVIGGRVVELVNDAGGAYKQAGKAA